MNNNQMVKRVFTTFLCIALFMTNYGITTIFASSPAKMLTVGDTTGQVQSLADADTDEIVEDHRYLNESQNNDPIEWNEEAAIYWNPGDGTESFLNQRGSPSIATSATSVKIDERNSKGSDQASGLTPDTAVENLNTAIRKAEKLSRRLEIAVSDVVIYAMNPMQIPADTSYTVRGKGITVVPWQDMDYIFIIQGGRLSLSNIIMCPDDRLIEPADSSLIYISSGVIRLGFQVESYGIFELDYTQSENTWAMASRSELNNSRARVDLEQEPVIELTKQFNIASEYRLDIHIPDDRVEEVTIIKSLSSNQTTVDEFSDAFIIADPNDEWDVFVAERVDGVLRNTNDEELESGIEQDKKASLSKVEWSTDQNSQSLEEQSRITQQNLVARRITNLSSGNQISGKLWLDKNADGVMADQVIGIGDYSVRLYPVDERSIAIRETKTLADGTYRFEHIKPGNYLVGIISEMIGEITYALPTSGITGDNSFKISKDNQQNIIAYSEEIIVGENSETSLENINAGLLSSLKHSFSESGEFVNLPLGGNKIGVGDTNKLVVMEADGDPLNGYYQVYSANESGLRSALFNLYQLNQSESDYILYIGANLTNLSASIFNDSKTATGTGNVTFASLQGRLNILVLTGNKDDLVTDIPATTAPANTSLISVTGTGERHFGSNIIIRNLRHTFNAGDNGTQGVYMNGYDLTLGGNSWQTTATRYFGGSSAGLIVPVDETATITVYSTGSGNSYFIGGMLTGTLVGNTEIAINGTSGNMFSIRGGGLGLSANAPANITGSVTNTISNMATGSGGLERFLGGVEYGTVGGSITNTISGTGRFISSDVGLIWTSGVSRFVGGSLYGNVGSEATLGMDVDTADLAALAKSNDYIIKNDIDTSNFIFGRACYIGTNHQSGRVNGNVINFVKSGTDNKGSISAFSGGAGYYAAIGGSWQNTFKVNAATAKVTNLEAGQHAAKAAAKYQLYGNITNVIAAGSISSSADNEHWFRGAGWGYMEGNAYSIVGTEGIVYLGNNSNYSYSTTNNAQGYMTGFDLAGGGGTISSNNSFYINGDTTLVTQNVRARWTYGGSFGGVQVGDSLRIHRGGVIDTCEGTGYFSYIHVGDGRAEVHGGQVDWFLSGGGWNDIYQDGHVSVEVFDQPNIIINASMGGTYGSTINHYISGDSTIIVHGGNFSGTARTAVLRGFSAAASNAGYIYGNASVTIDLRGNQYGFSIEPGDSISGGRRLGATGSSYLGTNSDNTVTLNVLTDDSPTDLLNGLNLYGDCASSSTYAGNTRAGHIIINVNASNAKIGNLYATSYENLSGGVLRKDVQVNLVSVGTLTGLFAGNGTENITNTIAQASATASKKAEINIGPQTSDSESILGDWEKGQTADGLPHRIQISTRGIIGFTEMDIQKRLLVALNGNIKNGLNATAANHGTNYQNFGQVTLHAGEGIEGAGLGIASADASFIAGTAYIEGKGEVYLQSTGQADQIVLTDLITNEDNTIVWMKVGNVRADNNLQTNWFGICSGWRVITLNPDKSKAKERITPVNFRGVEEATGKTFIGDSDTHFFGNNGYAVAVLGSVYTWEVTAGNGQIMHNVPVSTAAPSAGWLIDAYGTVAADTPSTKGTIAIPSALVPELIPYPKFSFIPDLASEEWVENVDIYGSDRYSSSSPHNYQIRTAGIGQIRTWTACGDDKEFSFKISAQFSKGDVQLTARNVIITETEAAAITYADQIISYTQARGVPLFQSNITAQLIDEINLPLEPNQIWRSHLVSYLAGVETRPESQLYQDAQIIVVNDNAIISADRQYALYANDATMTLAQAQALDGQSSLDQDYTNALVIWADGATTIPMIDNTVIPTITAATIPTNVLVNYTYRPDDQSELLEKNVTVQIKGAEQVSVIISQQVVGDYADRSKEFTFELYFQDVSGIPLSAGTRFSYVGDIIEDSAVGAAANGTMILDQDGKATFKLKHEQKITIAQVPQGKIRIIESLDPLYNVSFTDSISAEVTTDSDTGFITLEQEDRTFAFNNTRKSIVPTGISVDNAPGVVLLIVSILMMTGIVTGAIINYWWRRRLRHD